MRPNVPLRSAAVQYKVRRGRTSELPITLDFRGSTKRRGVTCLQIDRAGKAGRQFDYNPARAGLDVHALAVAIRIYTDVNISRAGNLSLIHI